MEFTFVLDSAFSIDNSVVKRIISFGIFLFVNKRARQSLEKYCSSHRSQNSTATLFNYIISNRIAVNGKRAANFL